VGALRVQKVFPRVLRALKVAIRRAQFLTANRFQFTGTAEFHEAANAFRS
jgi:hypothetical protein